MSLLKKGYIFVVLIFLAEVVQAASGAGDVATNLMQPVSLAANLVGIGSFVIGLTCLFGSILKYMQHRTNPLAHPISTVVLLLVMGIVLCLLPWAYKLTSSGVPVRL